MTRVPAIRARTLKPRAGTPRDPSPSAAKSLRESASAAGLCRADSHAPQETRRLHRCPELFARRAPGTVSTPLARSARSIALASFAATSLSSAWALATARRLRPSLTRSQLGDRLVEALPQPRRPATAAAGSQLGGRLGRRPGRAATQSRPQYAASHAAARCARLAGLGKRVLRGRRQAPSSLSVQQAAETPPQNLTVVCRRFAPIFRHSPRYPRQDSDLRPTA